ncbi:MAG: response regulator [Phycisphaerae bacterium]|jgi:FixJ family two-component response regulator
MGERSEPIDTPTVFVIDDDVAVRTSLSAAVESCGLRVQSYSRAEDFLQVHDPQRPGCVVSDLRMPGMDGLALQDVLRAQGSHVPVIFLTAYGDVATSSRAFRSGAVDFLDKPVRIQLLVRRIREALSRDVHCRRAAAEHAKYLAALALLTDRERKVLERSLAGCSPKQIARELRLTVRTIQLDREHLLEKMQVESLMELARISVLNVASPLDTDCTVTHTGWPAVGLAGGAWPAPAMA